MPARSGFPSGVRAGAAPRPWADACSGASATAESNANPLTSERLRIISPPGRWCIFELESIFRLQMEKPTMTTSRGAWSTPNSQSRSPNAKHTHWKLGVGTLGVVVFCLMLAARPASPQSSEHLEVVHHPGYDTTVSMPFVPAIKVKSGKLLWLAGGTALPVYHDHPHRRDQIVKYLPNDLEAQVRQTMDGIMTTLKAAGGSPRDVVHLFIFRARPQIGDIGRASAVVSSYFAPFNHKPTTTNLAVLELGEPEQLVEIQAVAVVD